MSRNHHEAKENCYSICCARAGCSRTRAGLYADEGSKSRISIPRLPTEDAAIALSQSPQVKWIEEDGTAQQAETQNGLLPWELDRIDQENTLPTCPNPDPNATSRLRC